MLINWSGFPFVRLVFFFIFGILLQLFLEISSGISHKLLWLLILAYFIFYFLYSKKYAFKPLFGLLAAGILFCFGMIIIYQNTPSNFLNHIINNKDKMLCYTAVVSSEIEEKNRSYKVLVEVTEINNGISWKQATGKVLIYLRKESIVNYKYGDKILIKGSPSVVPVPSNPEEFNYQKYLSHKGIYMQQFVTKEEIKWIGEVNSNAVVVMANTFRHTCDSIIKANVNSSEEYKIASALILGVRNSLDNKIRDAYSATGTMHILAVSGMHVSLIYFILMVGLGGLEKNRYGKVFLPIIMIMLLWFYALVTGFSASVLRAVAMFTFIVLGKAIDRNSNIYNTLALSAFVLVCFDPYLLMDVGFQLSYLAVFGIVYIYPKIYYLYEVDHKWLDQLWMITCVSIAAQLATFPLSLFYFHQFPVWFLFSNLMVIPISTVIMYLGLFLLGVGWIPFLSVWTGYCTEKLIWLMNKSIFLMQQLPYSVVDKIDIEWYEAIILYGIIIFAFLFIETRKFIWYKICFVVVCVLMSAQTIEVYNERKQHFFAVYAIHNHSILVFVKDNKAELIVDDSLFEDESKLKFHVYPHLWKCGVKQYDRKVFDSLPFKQLAIGKLFVRNNLSFLWIDQPWIYKAYKNKFKIDYVLVSNNALKKGNQLKEGINYKEIIFDSSNKKYWLTNFSDKEIYSTDRSGAFIQNKNGERF